MSIIVSIAHMSITQMLITHMTIIVFIRINVRDSLEMTRMAEVVGSRALADFVCHPDDEVSARQKYGRG